MRNAALILAAILVLAIPAGAAAPTAAPDVADATSIGRATIEVTARQTGFASRPGGVQVSRSQLYDRSGRPIGSRHLVCTRIVDSRRDCRGTFLFPRGMVVVGGTLNSRTRYVLAVVGGTGLYDNARGSLSITQDGNDPKRDRVFIQLVG